MKLTKSEKLAMRAAMHDLKREGFYTELISVRKHQSMLRPAEISGSTMNGKVLFKY